MDEAREDPNRPMPCADDFVPLLESNDSVMRRLLEKAQRAAASDATILLTGESGTGKHVLWTRAAQPNVFGFIRCAGGSAAWPPGPGA